MESRRDNESSGKRRWLSRQCLLFLSMPRYIAITLRWRRLDDYAAWFSPLSARSCVVVHCTALHCTGLLVLRLTLPNSTAVSPYTTLHCGVLSCTFSRQCLFVCTCRMTACSFWLRPFNASCPSVAALEAWPMKPWAHTPVDEWKKDKEVRDRRIMCRKWL